MDLFAIFPPRASTFAFEMDMLYLFLVAVSTVMTAVIFLGIFYFAVKYRRQPDAPRPKAVEGLLALELTWILIPFGVMMIMFGWGTKLYFESAVPPEDALDIYVTGKQWMWKIQHPGGQREINELHVPAGRPVKLTLASEDVIHSFYVPAFRVKRDVVPGRYQTIWFEATEPGRYRLFCAEYCGTGHSGMGGWVTVMEPVEYQSWLAGIARGESMADRGRRLFEYYGCVSCHVTDREGRCPPLVNVFGRPVELADGTRVIADEAYIRESIVNPGAKVVAGYPADLMPSFQGQLSEEELLQLVTYVKSLSTPPDAAGEGAP